jgi:polyisoprenoid-binding protein YceI
VNIRKLIARIVLLLLSTAVFAADTYKIDPVHSVVGFTVTHMVISHVTGNFTDFDGTIVYDEKDPAKCSVDVHIKTASVTTRNDHRDADLRSDHFFNADKFPEITFKSTRIEKTADGYIAHGPLSIRGTAKEVAIPFTIGGTVKDVSGMIRLGAQGSLTVNRQDYGVSWNKTLEGGGVLVSDDVKIDLAVEAVKQ